MTWLFMYGDLKITSSRVCGEQNRYFKPRSVFFPNPDQVLFVPWPNQIISTQLLQDTIEHFI